MNENLPGNPSGMPILVQEQTLRQHRLHFLIAKIRIALAISREFTSIVCNEFKTCTVRVEDLAATRSVLVAVGMLFNRVADANIRFILVDLRELPRDATCLRVQGNADAP